MNPSDFKEFLNYKIIEAHDFTITVYSLVITAFLLFLFIVFLRVVKTLFKRLTKKGTLDEGSSNSIFQIIKYIMWVIAIVMILESIGINVSILLASAAALLVGVGLGLQQLFNDIASGIILLIEQNLKVKDVIQLDDGIVGKVLSIGLRTSKIKTRDDIVMIVPNSKFVNGRIINWSHIDEKTRFFVNIGVAYGSDVELVKELLIKCAIENPGISTDPKPFVRFLDFGNSSLDFQLFFWIKESFYSENVKSEVRFAIDKAFRGNNVRIPFPQRDIHIYKEE